MLFDVSTNTSIPLQYSFVETIPLIVYVVLGFIRNLCDHTYFS